MPFRCQYRPATLSIYNSYDDTTHIVLLQQNQQCCLKIVSSLKWDTVRIIWIGFYKNDNNDSCFVDRLPKDIVLNIFHFLILDKEKNTGINIYKLF